MNRLVVVFAVCVLLLSGCGGSTPANTREVIVDGYSFALPKAYVDVSSTTVENKQLINKIVGSYKIPAETPGTFEPNIIITRSELSTQINFEQFWTINTQKLSAGLAGYLPGTKEVIPFTCDDRIVQGLLVFFRLKDPWYTQMPEVWLAQYQFVDNTRGYIISAVYPTEQDQKNFVDLLETLTCVKKTAMTGSTSN